MLNNILNSGLKMSVVDSRLSVRGSTELVGEFRAAIQTWKPEIVKILSGESVGDVGDCDHCHGSLIGLRTFDYYINRVCPDCGKWFRCLESEHFEKTKLLLRKEADTNKSGGQVLEPLTRLSSNC